MADEYAAKSVLFLEQNVDAPLGDRISRWWAAYGSGASVYLPLVMVDSGHRISNGSQNDFAAAYRALVEAELGRPPAAELEAYARAIGTGMRVYARLHNTSALALSTTNNAALHALVWEESRAGVTGRTVRAAPWVGIAPQLPPAAEFTATLETADLSGADLRALHTVVLADYTPGPGPAFDMLQGAIAEPAGLFADPETATVTIDASARADRSVPLRVRGPYVLMWTAATDVPWIKVIPETGTIGVQPTLTVAAARLSPGWQEGTVTLTASSQDGMSFARTVGVRTYLGPRVLRLGYVMAARGAIAAVPVEIDALGDESTVSFSVAFDPEVLRDPSVTAGADTGAAVLTVEGSETAAGRLGVTVALPAGKALDQDRRQLAVLSFTVSAGATGQTAAVGFGGEPVARRVADGNGTALSATYLDGGVALVGGPPVRPPRRRLPAKAP